MGDESYPRAIRLLVAGGGTGGHLFPGIAIAQEFVQRNGRNKVLFVNSGKLFERAALDQAGFSHAMVPAEGIKGKSLWEKFLSAAKIPKGLWQSLGIICRFKPDLLLGLGSYSSGVVILAGWLLGKKIVLCEQNRLPGITNRMLFPLADRLYVSFPGTQDRLKSKRVMFSGNPVRKSILEAAGKSQKGNGRRFTLLVIGGSQGAHAVNVAVTEALTLLVGKERFHFIHQTGTADAAWVNKAYADAGVSGDSAAFFNDMEKQYAAADLVICRSGATTVAELTALKKPAIFIPFPYAADDHQTLNAKELSDAGAAEIILQDKLDAKLLAQRIHHYAGHPEMLAEMASRAGAFGKPDAAATIVEDMYSLVHGGHGVPGMRE